MTTLDRHKLSGFSCPTCMVNLISSAQLQDHWIRYHSRGWRRRNPSSGWSTPTSVGSTLSRQNSRADGTGVDAINLQDYACNSGHEFVDCIISNATVCESCQGTIWNQCKQCRGCRIICHLDCHPKPLQSPEPLKQSSVQFSVTRSAPDYLSEFRQDSGARTNFNVSYVTDRLIDVSFPSSTSETIYATTLDNISSVLKKRHGEHYAVFNLSERRYDIGQKNDKVLDLGWPDHLAPPLDRLISIIRTIDCWFNLDPDNVAVLHCKGGRSRTAVVIAAFIQYSKHIPSPQAALGWFSLKQYYETKLAGKLQPSQRRYVKYFSDLLERKFKLGNSVLNLDELVLNGIPVTDEANCQIYLRIYQGYQLVHTTDTCVLKGDNEKITVKVASDVNLLGDTLIKCSFSENAGKDRETIFRCQFHVDAIANKQLVLQKAELDGASRNKRFPESCFVEINFKPTVFGFSSLAMDTEVGGYYNEQELYRGPKHIPGPLNGNPYAQIDPSMKTKARQMADQTRVISESKPTTDLGRGIKDLDDLLGELGHLTQTYQARKGQKDVNSNVVIVPTLASVEMSSNGADDCSSKGSSSEMSSVDGESKPCLPQRSSSYTAVTRLHVSGVGKGTPRSTVTYNDDTKISETEEFVFPQENALASSNFADEVFEAVSPTVHDLLNELNRSTLNSGKGYMKKHNASSYDNYDTSGTESNDGDSTDSYRSGMVASHVKQFNELWSCPDPSKVAGGVPLPGLVQGVDIEDRISKYNKRSVAPGHRGPQNEQLYLSGSPPTKIIYEVDKKDDSEFDPRLLTFDDLHIYRHRNYNGNAGEGTAPSIDHSALLDQTIIQKPPPEFLDETDSAAIATKMDSIRVDNKDMDSPTFEVRPGSDSAYGDSSSLSTPVTSQAQSDKILESDIVDYPSPVERQSQSQISDDDPGYMKIEDIPISRTKRISDEISEERIESSAARTVEETVPLDLDLLDLPPLSRPSYKLTLEPLLQTTAPTVATPVVTVTDSALPSEQEAAALIKQSKDLLASLQNARRQELLDQERSLDISLPLRVKANPGEGRHTPPNLDLSGVDTLKDRSQEFVDKNISSGFHYVDSNTQSRPIEDVHTGREDFINPETPRALRSNEVVPSFPAPTRSRSVEDAPSPTRATLRRGRLRRVGSAGSAVNVAELFPEVARYPHIKFDHITLGYWYKPHISRDEAVAMLKDKEPGAFVVRDSQSYGGAFGLAVKVATPPLGVIQQAGGDLSKIDMENELVRHFLIEPARQGVRLKGSTNEPFFPSLVALIYQHSLTKMALPVNLKLPTEDLVRTPQDFTDGKGVSEQELLSKGVGCDVVYLRSIHVEGLSGEGAVNYAMDKLLNTNDMQSSTVINFKVDEKGITLTDNERRLFFRKHFQLRHVLFCAVDPQNRRWNLSRFLPGSAYEASCFALVVSKPGRPFDHDCHVFAEVTADQPSASVIVSFVDRALKLSKK